MIKCHSAVKLSLSLGTIVPEHSLHSLAGGTRCIHKHFAVVGTHSAGKNEME